MKKNSKVIISLLMVLALTLVSCGTKKGSEGTTDSSKGTSKGVKMDLPYPSIVKKDGKTVGGTLNIALVSSSPFKGIFNNFLSEDAYDDNLDKPLRGNFMMTGKDQEIINGGYCDVDFNKEAKTATLKLNKGLTWCDGVPVTSDDLIFCYESICNKEYTGVRYDSNFQNVVGAVEYNEGKADTISGLKKIDDKTLEVTFKVFYPSILWGSGVMGYAEPKHYLKDVPLKDMEACDQVRVKPLSFGPFMVSNIVPGESVEYVPNPYWFGDKPLVDKIIYKRQSPDTIVEALKAGTYDIVDEVNVNSYNEYKDLSNLTFASKIENYYQYLGFKLGKFDMEAGKVIPDPNKKMSDVKLRQAIAYSMDNAQVGETFYNGLRVAANSVIDPAHATFWHSEMEGYDYNPEKAKQILDEAGYVDKDGDGKREDPKGNKLQINFLSMAGGDIAEPIAQFHLQNWNDVGLDVVLLDGRLIEFNAFYEMVEADDPKVDIFLAAWGTGSDPNPSDTYGRDAQYNMGRYASEENDKLLKAIASEDAFGPDGIDYEYLLKAYHDWQTLVHNDVPVAPALYRIQLTALNNRVNYWDLTPGSTWDWEKIGLFSDTPEVAK